MRVQILQETWSYENNAAEVDKLIENIQSFLGENLLHLSSMRIDGNEIYEDFQDYIMEHIDQIEVIDILVQTTEEMTHQILLATEQYLERAFPEMERVSTEFYQGPSSESWDLLSQLTEGIEWIYQMMQAVGNTETNHDQQLQLKAIAGKLDQLMPDFSDAIQIKNFVGIADAVRYELIPTLQELQDLLKQTIDNKVVRPHVS